MADTKKQALTINLNQKAKIYPTAEGWRGIREAIQYDYVNMSEQEAERIAKSRKTADGGYKDRIWRMISELGDLFFFGTDHFKGPNITVYPLNEE